MRTIVEMLRPTLPLMPALALLLGGPASAVDSQTPTTNAAIATSGPNRAASSRDFVRVDKLIGMRVRGADGKDIGTVRDVLINLPQGEVRYAVFEFDPGSSRIGKIYAVPLRNLRLDSGGGSVSYPKMTDEGLDRSTIAQSDWKSTLQGARFIDDIDAYFGYQPSLSRGRTQRATALLGKDIEANDGKVIGELVELVVDMGESKLRYAVVAFAPQWSEAGRVYAFAPEAFASSGDSTSLVLAVDRSRVAALRSVGRERWQAAQFDDSAIPVNPAP